MDDITNEPIFSGTVDNPLGQITDWMQHKRLTVGVHRQYTFNRQPVAGMVEIIQQSDDDAIDDTPEDFRDLEGEASIVTTPNGARALAALLLKAATAAERAGVCNA